MLENESIDPGSSERRREVDAYNAVFEELGLEWHLSPEQYEDICAIEGEENRIRAYLEAHRPHLLKVYDVDFLCGLIADARRRRHVAGWLR